MANNKASKKMTETGPGASSEVDFQTMNPESDIMIDQELVKSLENKIKDKKEEIKNKVYAITFSEDLLQKYEKFINEEAEWNSTEAIGVKEIAKNIQKIKKDGVKNGVIYLGALALEATHYFISKSKGKGLKQAEAFIDLYKPFDQALSDAKMDAAEVKDLDKQLAAAMQGISLG
jgi:hypothetical protein